MSNTRDFLLEIGCEELPSAPLIAAQKQLQTLFADELNKAQLSYESLEVLSTPRRLSVLVYGLQEEIEEQTLELRGPAASIAYDEEGNLQKSALGFARGKGLNPEDLYKKLDADGREYVFGKLFKPAQHAQDLLVDIVKAVIPALAWPRSQRWGNESQKFVRPIRWICCLFGSDVISVTYADVTSSHYTFGHRVLAPGKHTVASPKDYREVLRSANVLLNDERREKILESIKAYESDHEVHVDMPEKVFNEVVNLCEWPDMLVGTFDKEFLEVPHEIICESMLSNQRYFPVYKDGKLTQQFILVSNGNHEYADTIQAGNERVVRARLSDAQFFYKEDLKTTLDDLRKRLGSVMFQEDLGTVYQKTERMESLAGFAANELKLDEQLAHQVVRCAQLAKSDLVSQAVVEFPSQQGVMGGYYALAQGEPVTVAKGVSEHYHPRFAGDDIPSTLEGKIVALADKLDTICGIFAINQPPTGSSDPFAVRRSTLGVIALLRELPALNLSSLIEFALDSYVKQGIEFNPQKVQQEVETYFLGRLSALVKAEGIEIDTIESLAFIGASYPEQFIARAHALQDVRNNQRELFDDLATAYARASHLTDFSLGFGVDSKMLSEVEANLLDACVATKSKVDVTLAQNDFKTAFELLATLRDPIDTFFDEVLVMDEDLDVRENRIRLLNVFTQVFERVARIGSLAKK